MVYSKLTVLDSTSQTSKLSLNKRVYIEYSERLLSSESGHSAKLFELILLIINARISASIGDINTLRYGND